MKASLAVVAAVLVLAGCANMRESRESASYGASTAQMAMYCPHADTVACTTGYLP